MSIRINEDQTTFFQQRAAQTGFEYVHLKEERERAKIGRERGWKGEEEWNELGGVRGRDGVRGKDSV